MRRHTILDAARQVFAKKGFARATLDEVARQAEFGKGTLYNYFPGGKEELLIAVVGGVYDELLTLVHKSFTEDDDSPTRDRFQHFLERAFELFTANQALFAILMKESYRMALSDRKERVDCFIEQRGRVARALSVPIREAIERGEFRPLPPETVAHMLLGNIQGCQILLSVSGCDTAEEGGQRPRSTTEAARFLTEMLFDGLILNGPTTSTNSDS